MVHHSFSPSQLSDFDFLLRALQSSLSCSALKADHMEDLPGHLHHIHIIRLSNGSRLILKVGLPPTANFLNHERKHLETEAETIALLAKSNIPIPRILKYEHRTTDIGLPFLLSTHLPGISYAKALPYMTRQERSNIEQQLQSLRSIINQNCSSTFGGIRQVHLEKGFKTWREAFSSMMESIFVDGENVMVNLPYFQIRESISRWEIYLDDVQEARLVVLGFGRPENVLINRRTNEVTGLLDFGRAIWGDADMSEQQRGDDIKSHLYTCYEAVVTIVQNHYRCQGDERELGARKALTKALERLTVETS